MYRGKRMTAGKKDRESSTVAICGAGIGGLSLAVRLVGSGFRPIVFEARGEVPTINEGVFLTLAPNGTNGLRALGCFEPVRADGIDTTGIEILNAKGKRLGLADQADHERIFGADNWRHTCSRERGKWASTCVSTIASLTSSSGRMTWCWR